jgi:hypothetical protein
VVLLLRREVEARSLMRRGRREASELLYGTAGSCEWDMEISIEAEI